MSNLFRDKEHSPAADASKVPAKNGPEDQPKLGLGRDTSIPTPPLVPGQQHCRLSSIAFTTFYASLRPWQSDALRASLPWDLTNRADATALRCIRTTLLTLAVDVGFSQLLGLAAFYEVHNTLSPRKGNTKIPNTSIAGSGPSYSSRRIHPASFSGKIPILQGSEETKAQKGRSCVR